MANHRRGSSRGTRSGRRRGQLPANKDPVILQRRLIGLRLWHQGCRAEEIRQAVNTWLESIGEMPVSLSTVYHDRGAVREHWRERDPEKVATWRAQHVATLQMLKRDAWGAFDEALPDDPNRARYLAVVRTIEMDIAKLTGLFPDGRSRTRAG